MNTSQWFDDLPVLAKMDTSNAALKLREIGEDDLAQILEENLSSTTAQPSISFGVLDRIWPFHAKEKMWLHTAHAFGYFAPIEGESLLPIQHAGNIKPDKSLKGKRIRITLDCFRVASYPGRGIHRVLFDFYAQNQVKKNVEHVHFNSAYRIMEGERAAIIGYPIFIGLYVGEE